MSRLRGRPLDEDGKIEFEGSPAGKGRANEPPDFEAFAWAVLADWPENCPDEVDIQDLAVKHGLLIPEQRTPPCGEYCWCAEYHGSGEPVTCYHRAESSPAREAP